MSVIKAQLLVQEKDACGYVTYVFKCLDEPQAFGHQYLMCTRCPNWETRDIDNGEIGYLEYQEVEAGKDTYYDRCSQQFVPYNFTNIYFIKFVKEADNSKKDIIL